MVVIFHHLYRPPDNLVTDAFAKLFVTPCRSGITLEIIYTGMDSLPYAPAVEISTPLPYPARFQAYFGHLPAQQHLHVTSALHVD